jgi:hypothetical protein
MCADRIALSLLDWRVLVRRRRTAIRAAMALGGVRDARHGD